MIQRVPDLPGVFAQVWHEAGGAYTVEHRDGDRQFEARAGEPEAVIAALTGWARQEAGWDGGPDACGFVYFHTQCTDSAAAGHGLTLLHGGFDGSAETTAAIGHEVVAALEGVGLHSEWNGDPGRAITVTPLDWRRRLVG